MDHDAAAMVSGLKGVQFIKSIPIFSILTDEELADLRTIIMERCFAKGSIILLEEDTPNYMYIIYSGKVKVVQTSAEGKEHIIAIHRKGDFFGEMSILDGKTSPATVIALENSTVGLIARENFDRYLMGNRKVLGKIIALLCTRLRDAWLKIKVLSFADAEQRVRVVLDQIGRMHGVHDDRGVILTLKLTHKDIAGYANVSRETVSRLLSRLKGEGEIEMAQGKQIVLKAPFARNMVNY